MKPIKTLFAFCLLTVLLWGPGPTAGRAASDHRQYMKGPYPDGISVTKACISCHKDSAEEVLHSAHWLWKGPSPFVVGHEQDTDLGKRNLLNNF